MLGASGLPPLSPLKGIDVENCHPSLFALHIDVMLGALATVLKT